MSKKSKGKLTLEEIEAAAVRCYDSLYKDDLDSFESFILSKEKNKE